MSRERQRYVFVPFAALFVFGALLTAWILASSRIPRGADQAVVGLMARHILDGRGHPVFYWGSSYGGTLEPHLLVPIFAMFGATVASLRGFYVALYGIFLAGTVLLTLRFFGRRAALFAAALAAAPPFFLPYKMLTSDGAYASVALQGLATAALVLEGDAEVRAGKRAVMPLALLGILAGMGLWLTPVTLPVSLVALAWLVARGPARPRGAALAGWIAGAAVGSLPWWLWNARHGWASVKARELAPASGHSLVENVLGFAKESIPVLLGAARPHFSDDPHASFPGALIVVPVVVALLLVPALSEARRDPRLRLFLLVLLGLGGTAIVSGRLTPSEPRYLVASYAFLFPLVGVSAARVSERRGRALAIVAVAGIAASDVSGAVHAHAHLQDVDDRQVSAPLDPLIETLDRLHVDRAYANYWTAYRLAFESGGRIVATPLFREDGSRSRELEEIVQRAADPAVVLLPPRDDCFRRALEETRAPFRETRSGAFSVFDRLAPDVASLIGRAGTLPMPSAGYRIVWTKANVPRGWHPGSQEAVKASVRNEGPCTWMHSVRLVASWEGPAPSIAAFLTPDRRVGPGETAELALTLTAPRAPGRYILTLDLEQQDIARFSSRGGAAYQVNVDVGP